jgi:hypothetical protein
MQLQTIDELSKLDNVAEYVNRALEWVGSERPRRTLGGLANKRPKVEKRVLRMITKEIVHVLRCMTHLQRYINYSRQSVRSEVPFLGICSDKTYWTSDLESDREDDDKSNSEELVTSSSEEFVEA